MTDQRIGIVGYGRFGGALCGLLVDAGYGVRAYDPLGEVPGSIAVDTLEALADGVDVVVLAVPVPVFAEVLGGLKPRLRARQLVIDVGSVKIEPEAILRSVLGESVPWAATHPLFGPASLARGEKPRQVVVCPNPSCPDAVRRARQLFESIECVVVEQDAETHDRHMAETHALVFFLAKGLCDLGAGERVALTPPSFQAIARAVEAVRADAGHLFMTVQRNPFAAGARRRLIDALQGIDEQLARGGDANAATPLSIPDLGSQAPHLLEARALIDDLDAELIELLSRRAELALRAGRAKARAGQAVRDPAREHELLLARAAEAHQRGLDEGSVRDIFEAVLRQSRGLQRRGEH